MVCDILEIFEEATNEVEISQKPTLFLVLPWFHRLLAHLEYSAVDSVLIAKMKDTGREYMRNNLSKHISMRHRMATFLNPIDEIDKNVP